jgi:predicted secreted protein
MKRASGSQHPSEIRNQKLEIPTALIIALIVCVQAGCTVGQGMSRGSATTLLSVADEIRFTNADLGKSINLRRNQTLLVVLKSDSSEYGRWTVKCSNSQILALLTTAVRGENRIDDHWLFTARGYGNCSLKMVYTPYDDTVPPREHTSYVWVRNIQ